MFNVNDVTITSLETITAFDITTGNFKFVLDELQSATIAQSQDKTDITGKQGRKLSSLKRNKAVTISGNKAAVSGGGVYSNVIFMGQPLIMAMYGAEGLIFCVAVMFTCNVFLFTVCSILFGMGGEHGKPALQMLKEAFLNLICLSAVVGVFCFVNSISLPGPIYDVLQYSANTTVSLSMIYIGSLLAAANLREIFRDKVVYIFSFFTLIVLPILAKAICGLFMEGIALSVLVVLMGTPAAAALPSFAELYGNDEKRASQYTFVSTIISVVTLPLVAEFLCQ